MDGGAVEFGGLGERAEPDARPSLPRAWVAFLIALCATATTLTAIVVRLLA